MTTYELWEMGNANRIGEFPSVEVALSAVWAVIDTYPEMIRDLVLVSVNDAGRTSVVMEGAVLANAAMDLARP